MLGHGMDILHDGVGNLHIRQRPGEGNSVQHPIGGTYVVNEQRVPVTEYSDGGVDGTRIDGGEDHGEA